MECMTNVAGIDIMEVGCKEDGGKGWGVSKGKSVNRQKDRFRMNALQRLRLLRFKMISEAGSGGETDFREDNTD